MIKIKGYPKYLNTKADYLYVKYNFPKEKWLPDFQALLDNRIKWMSNGKLNSLEDGIIDKIHKVETLERTDDKLVEYYQYEYKADPNCKMERLGFTVKEIQQIIKDIA